MQRSSVVPSGHNLLDKAGFWDQNQNGKWLLALQRKYKANKEKAELDYPPLLRPTHWSPSYFLYLLVVLTNYHTERIYLKIILPTEIKAGKWSLVPNQLM